jgi:hypothetical protein
LAGNGVTRFAAVQLAPASRVVTAELPSIDAQEVVLTERASRTRAATNIGPVDPTAARLMHRAAAARSFLRPAATATVDELDAEILSRSAPMAARRVANDWQDRTLLKNDETSFGDDLDLDCVDEVFALLAAN